MGVSSETYCFDKLNRSFLMRLVFAFCDDSCRLALDEGSTLCPCNVRARLICFFFFRTLAHSVAECFAGVWATGGFTIVVMVALCVWALLVFEVPCFFFSFCCCRSLIMCVISNARCSCIQQSNTHGRVEMDDCGRCVCVLCTLLCPPTKCVHANRVATTTQCISNKLLK